MKKILAIISIFLPLILSAQTFKPLMVRSADSTVSYPDLAGFLAANGIASSSDIAQVGLNATNFITAQVSGLASVTQLQLQGTTITNAFATKTAVALQGTTITNVFATITSLQLAGTTMSNVFSTTAYVQLQGTTISNTMATIAQLVLATNALDATAINRGTVADARLSSNVPLKDGVNIFTGGITFSGGVSNSQLTTLALISTDSNKKEVSIANGVGYLTNNGSGVFSWVAGSSGGVTVGSGSNIRAITNSGIVTFSSVTPSNGTPGSLVMFDSNGTPFVTNLLHFFPGYWTSAAVRVVGEGDSMMIGGGGVSLTNNPLSRFFSSNAPANWIYVTNYGVAGERLSDQITSEYATEIYPQRPSVNGGVITLVPLWAGVNDLKAGTNAATLFAKWSNYVYTAHVDGFLIMAFKLNSYQGITDAVKGEMAEFNDRLEHAAGLWDWLIDVPAFLPAPPGNDLYVDQFHFSALGNQKIAYLIDGAFKSGIYNKNPKQPNNLSSSITGESRTDTDRGQNFSEFIQSAQPGRGLAITGNSGHFYGDVLSSSGVASFYAHNGSGNIAAVDVYLSADTSIDLLTFKWPITATNSVGGTNVFTGKNSMETNMAPMATVLNPFTINTFYTNTTGHRASPFLCYILTDSSISGSPCILFTNLTTTESYSFSNSFVLTGSASLGSSLPELSPNDIILFTNKSSGSATAAISGSSLKLK